MGLSGRGRVGEEEEELANKRNNPFAASLLWSFLFLPKAAPFARPRQTGFSLNQAALSAEERVCLAAPINQG